MHTHFIGASGAGMVALAVLLREGGDDVSVSDDALHPSTLGMLGGLGVRCAHGFDASHLDPLPDAVVVGQNVGGLNPEATQAALLGIPRASMAETLRARILSARRPLVVTGGARFSASAMCAWALSRAGTEAGWILSRTPTRLSLAAMGSPRIRPDRGRTPFVVEGAPTSASTAGGPDLLECVGITKADVAVFTGLSPGGGAGAAKPAEADERVYRAFIRAVPTGGLVVAAAEDPLVRAIVQSECRAPVAYVALEHDDTGDVTPTWLGAPAAPGPDALPAFDLYAGGMRCGRFTLRSPGLDLVRSAIACVAACAEGFGVDVGELRKHLGTFEHT